MTENDTTHGGRRPGAGRKAGPVSTDAQRFAAARATKEEALARLREAEAGQKERRLIPVAEVDEVMALAFATVAQRLLTLPDELERNAGLSPEQAELAENTIHAAMEQLAEELATLGMEADSIP